MTIDFHTHVFPPRIKKNRDKYVAADPSFALLYSDKKRGDLLVFPQHEAIMGVAHSTQADDRNRPISFKSKGDAMKAYNEGRIGVGTRVQIGSKK